VFSVLSVEFNVEFISENYRIDNMSFAHNLRKGNLQNVDYLDYRLLQHACSIAEQSFLLPYCSGARIPFFSLYCMIAFPISLLL